MMKDNIVQSLQALYDRHDNVTPSLVVKTAKSKRSPLHSLFEWDDQKAGHQYRLWQARHLIVRVKLASATSEEPSRMVNVRSISSAEDEGREGAYKPLSAVVQSKSEFQLVLETALSRLHSAQRAVDDLKAAVGKSDDDSLARILMAYEALATANTALSSMH